MTIPNSVTSIGYAAFYYCSGLTSITIGNSVTSIGENAFYDCDVLEVISKIEDPFDMNTDTFSDNTFYNATLYVPSGTIDKYMAKAGWKKFLFIEEGDGGSDTPPEPSKCEKPTISYQNGKLMFNSATEGVTFHSTISDTDINSYDSNEVQLGVTYNISVYATKEGYDNSETVTATLCWIDVTPEGDNVVVGKAEVRATPVLIQSNGSVLSIRGVAEGTTISVYDTAGRMVGSATAASETTNVSTTLRSGEIGIVKIGEKAVKVAIK